MLPYGKLLCPKCYGDGNGIIAAEEACFRTIVQHSGRMFTYDIVPHCGSLYGAKPKIYRNDGKTKARIPAGRIHVRTWKHSDGLTTRIQATVRERDGTAADLDVSLADRVCPTCGKPYPEDMGFSPQYYIALVGPPGVGKTSLLRCVVSPSGLSDINRLVRCIGLKCRSIRRSPDRFKAEATQSGIFEDLTSLQVFDESSGRLLCTLNMVDGAGEDLMASREGKSLSEHALEHIDVVTDVGDFVLAMYDDKDLPKGGTTRCVPPNGDTTGSPRQTLIRTMLQADHRKIVIAVLNKCDLMSKSDQNGAMSSPGGRCGCGPRSETTEKSSVGMQTGGPTLFERVLASDTPSGLMQKLACHSACANVFLRENIDPGFELTEDTFCCAISAGSVRNRYDSHSGRSVLEHCSRDEVNAALPFVYILVQLFM